MAWWRSRWFQGVGSLMVVALIFGFSYLKVAVDGEVWKTITAMTPIELSRCRCGLEAGELLADADRRAAGTPPA